MKLYELIVAWLQRLRGWLTASEATTGIALATLVGVVAGLGAVAFRWLIASFHSLFFDEGEQVLGALGGHYVILVPVVGGLFVGLIIHFLAREAKGHGVPEVMAAVAAKGGAYPCPGIRRQSISVVPMHR